MSLQGQGPILLIWREIITGEKTTTVGLKTGIELEVIVKILPASDSNKIQAEFSFLVFEGSQCNLVMTLLKMMTLFEKNFECWINSF